jgi:hypothetical protein
VAPKRAHTRANQEGPLTTPVPDPEKIISKGKSLQRQAFGSAKTLNSGIQTDTYSFISKRYLVESPAAETHSSQEIENLSQILKVRNLHFLLILLTLFLRMIFHLILKR